MAKEKLKKELPAKEEKLSLNDDRRVKVLSPGAMVAKRFFRNKVAVVGLTILIAMFLFSFLGGLISPYKQSDFFYRTESLRKEIGGCKYNDEYRYLIGDETAFTAMIQANARLAIEQEKDTFTYKGKQYKVSENGNELYEVSLQDKTIGALYKDIVWLDDGSELAYDDYIAVLEIYANGDSTGETEVNSHKIAVDDNLTVYKDDAAIGYVSRYIIQSVSADIVFSRTFKEELLQFLDDNQANFAKDGSIEKDTFMWTKDDGSQVEYSFAFNAANDRWQIREGTTTTVYDSYAAPSKDHWLGTDSKGMDMLTRLMYGGRVSLIIGFIVVFIESLLGVILGGISGYFGKWVDMLIMRIVDILYCIPSTPLLIIIGAAMDAMQVDPKVRMIYLMLILGFLGWPSIARMVRGQILSLREQEFMTATEATGLSVARKIGKHLIPNVIPQLIVIATMGLGSTILTEATLSFLGLGVRFPFASWGNIINDVASTYVLTTYLWVWIPAGCCILLTVLAFNLVGDGLRDAFDPKMKR